MQNNTLRLTKNDPEALKEALLKWAEDHGFVRNLLLDAYCFVDLNNQVVEFNEAFMELCGESYRKVLKIGNFCDLIKTEHCPEQCPAIQVVSGEQPIRLDELSGSSKAYPELQMILSGVPIITPEYGLVGSLISIRNVSAESLLQKKYDTHKKESVTDGLTKLYNKKYSESSLRRFVKASYREGGTTSVMMCDIDHFKKVNDTYGHQAGDYVLAEVAKILGGSTRDTDIVGRFGGEEFMAILTSTEAPGARIFAERFRNKIAGTQFKFGDKIIPVTVSLGTCSHPGNKAKWPNVDIDAITKEMVRQADEALYHAKRTGRNRTVQAEELTPVPEQPTGSPAKT